MSGGARPIVLVTGAGTGVGRVAALALMANGFDVVLTGRTRRTLDDVASDAARQGWSAEPIVADVADEDSVQSLFARIEAERGRLDLLFNNGGVVIASVAIDEMSLLQWRSVLDVYLTGAFICARAAFALMKRQRPRGGRIINDGSVSARKPRPNSVAYTAS
jgi:NAD(P)-dependent dehydrogenase (short-subunit alcohol dehydrogenase family)